MKMSVTSSIKPFFFIIITVFFCSPSVSPAGRWVNPKDQFKSVDEVRLQRGKKELSEIERQNVKKYGFTGLELMTYLFFNQEPGDHDYDSCWNIYTITPQKKILKMVASDRNIYLFENKLDLITLEGIKPGEVWRR